MGASFNTKDLLPCAEWLVSKKLLPQEHTKQDFSSSVQWMKRHLHGIKIITMRQGVPFVSAADAEQCYKLYHGSLPQTQKNKEYAAAKLNAKNNTRKIFEKGYRFTTKEQRDAFYVSPTGKNAIAFFLWNITMRKPHLIDLAEDAQTKVAPSDELKKLLSETKTVILHPKVASYVFGTPVNTPTHVEPDKRTGDPAKPLTGAARRTRRTRAQILEDEAAKQLADELAPSAASTKPIDVIPPVGDDAADEAEASVGGQ